MVGFGFLQPRSWFDFGCFAFRFRQKGNSCKKIKSPIPARGGEKKKRKGSNEMSCLVLSLLAFSPPLETSEARERAKRASARSDRRKGMKKKGNGRNRNERKCKGRNGKERRAQERKKTKNGNENYKQ